MGKMETLEHADALERGLTDIGRASKASGVSVKMIRHYEAIGLLKAARTHANYRVYGPNDLHVLRFIRRARALGFSMEEIRELLGLWRNKTRSSASVKKIAGAHVDGLRRKIAEKMQDAKRRIPHFAYVEEADLTELEELRTHLNASKRNDQPKLTILPFLMRALVLALPDFPQINARFDDEQGVVFRHEAVDIGIATQTDNGLIVPVVRHAETRDIWDCAAEVSRLAAAVVTSLKHRPPPRRGILDAEALRNSNSILTTSKTRKGPG